MSKMKKSNLSVLLIFSMVTNLFVSTASFAAEVDTKNQKVVTDLKKGDKAPYDGILLTQRLAAEIKENCNPDVQKKKCDIQVKEAVDLANSDCTRTTDILKAKIEACETTSLKIIDAKNKEIESLRDLLKPPPWYKDSKVMFEIGAVIGLAVGGTAVYFLRKL